MANIVILVQFGYYQACENGTQCPFSTLMTLDSNFQACTQGFDSRVRESVNRAAVDFTNDYMVRAAVHCNLYIQYAWVLIASLTYYSI